MTVRFVTARHRSTLLAACSLLLILSLLTIHPSSRAQLVGFSSNVYSASLMSPFAATGPLGPIEHGIATVRGQLSSHPILELIKLGRKRAAEIEAKRKSVNTLEAAVKDYRLAFGIDPPEGFDIWYEYAATRNSTTAPSLLPLAHESVLPFLALPPAVLRERARKTWLHTAIVGIQYGPGDTADERVKVLHDWDYHFRTKNTGKDWVKIVKELSHLFPPPQDAENPVQIAIWLDDASYRMTDGDLVEQAKTMARNGEVWDNEELERLENATIANRGWASTCPSGIRPNVSMLPDAESDVKRFIVDHPASMDWCHHPELLRQNGELLMRDELPMRRFTPIMGISKLINGADILGPPTQRVDEYLPETLPWANKTENRILYRGLPTGIFHIDRYQWRLGQRDRLAFLGQSKEVKMTDVLVDRTGTGGGVVQETWDQRELADKYLNVGLVKKQLVWNCAVSGPIRFACYVDENHPLPDCPGSGLACKEMEDEIEWKEVVGRVESQRYKFILDVDGFGWSSRWRKELSLGSVIIKTTLYNEWWTAQAIPWYHYVPGLYDYSDLFDIVSFFGGPPDGSTSGRDDLAEEIARNGRVFARDRLRWEDIRSYMLLILLEYRRAWSNDREAASYHL